MRSPLLLAVLAVVPAACSKGPKVADEGALDSTSAALQATKVDTFLVDPVSTRLRFSGGGFTDVVFQETGGYVLAAGDSVVGFRVTARSGSAFQEGVATRGADLGGAAYFNAAAAPDLVLASDRIVQDGAAGSSASFVDGTFAMRGLARAVRFDGSLRPSEESVGATFTFAVAPSDWDTTGAVAFRDSLRFRLNLVARAKGAASPGAAIRQANRYRDSVAAAEQNAAPPANAP